jgi:hypothetical protein
VDPPLSTLSILGAPSTFTPRQQLDVALVLAAPHPSTLTGKLTLTFTSKAEVPGDDPMTQFSNLSRTVTFTIPANTTSAVFPSQTMLLTGTVAGTVTLTADIDNGPAGMPVSALDVQTIAPQMTAVKAVKTLQGIDVEITGFATSRRVSNVEFLFDWKRGSATGTVAQSRNVDPDFASWFRSTASTPYGGQFSFVQSFTISQSDLDTIQAVTVRLTNAQGSTTSARIPLQ